MAAHGTTDRLTDDDRRRVSEAIEALAAQLPAEWTPGQRLEAAMTASRLGAHAIGCGLHDLRPVEQDWIHAEARRILGGDDA